MHQNFTLGPALIPRSSSLGNRTAILAKNGHGQFRFWEWGMKIYFVPFSFHVPVHNRHHASRLIPRIETEPGNNLTRCFWFLVAVYKVNLNGNAFLNSSLEALCHST